jgi:hypothetical protein
MTLHALAKEAAAAAAEASDSAALAAIATQRLMEAVDVQAASYVFVAQHDDEEVSPPFPTRDDNVDFADFARESCATEGRSQDPFFQPVLSCQDPLSEVVRFPAVISTLHAWSQCFISGNHFKYKNQKYGELPSSYESWLLARRAINLSAPLQDVGAFFIMRRQEHRKASTN